MTDKKWTNMHLEAIEKAAHDVGLPLDMQKVGQFHIAANLAVLGGGTYEGHLRQLIIKDAIATKRSGNQDLERGSK